ncbi:gluconate:H+ symporter [Treponema sp. HNW]|uniref:GntP family permease n=1 Tax=Treponema sp. HNW TaxID=3116654 RepID=UPI003D14B332
MTDSSGVQMLIALAIGLATLLFIMLKTRLHVFVALIASACMIGLAEGMNPTDVGTAITNGFGGTLSSIGIIIGLGIMLGRLFEMSGAAQRMAYTFLKLFGKNREEEVLALTGFIVSIPIFCESSFIILSPLTKAISRQTKKSIVGLSIALASGLVITHTLVPPTPGPLGVAGTFGVDIGQFMLTGFGIAVLPTIICMIYAKKLGKKIYQIPGETGRWIRPLPETVSPTVLSDAAERALPPAFLSFAPLITPIVLIILNRVLTSLEQTEGVAAFFILLGRPIIAITIALILASYTLVIKKPRRDVLAEMEDSIKSAGSIILVTGAGGSLGQIIKSAGVGNYIASGIAATSLPIILLPFIIATLIRFIQGSGTVAMLTAAGITAPIVAAAGGNMILAGLAACCGSLFFSYFNDSFFWVVNRLSGISDTKEQIKVWSVTTTIAWAVSFIELLILDIFI